MQSNSMLIAEAVVACFKKVVLEEFETSYIIESFSNCREQGFAISVYEPKHKACCVAENRNSDHIVVYFTDKYLQNGGNLPQDDQWENRKMFDYNQPYQAAEFIAEYLGVSS
jgi:hypothetical protein